MSRIGQVIRHPAGKIGITVGLTFGLIAAVMGEASKALLFVGICRFIASRLQR
jgi:hypothetical protein